MGGDTKCDHRKRCLTENARMEPKQRFEKPKTGPAMGGERWRGHSVIGEKRGGGSARNKHKATVRHPINLDGKRDRGGKKS